MRHDTRIRVQNYTLPTALASTCCPHRPQLWDRSAHKNSPGSSVRVLVAGDWQGAVAPPADFIQRSNGIANDDQHSNPEHWPFTRSSSGSPRGTGSGILQFSRARLWQQRVSNWRQGCEIHTPVCEPDYPEAFLASLPQAPENFNAEDLADMFHEWQSPSYRLSDELRQRGEELTELEVVVWDAVQTLHKQFRNGMAVSFRAIQRIAFRYHFDVVQGVKLRKVANRLHGRGLCKISHSTFRLLKHSGPERTKATPSKLERLTTDPMQGALLTACDCCTGTGFKNRNVVARAAVKSLMLARFNITKNEFNKLARELITAEVLEEIQSKGTTAFRLTPSAEIALKGKVKTLEEATAEESCYCCTAIFWT